MKNSNHRLRKSRYNLFKKARPTVIEGVSVLAEDGNDGSQLSLHHGRKMVLPYELRSRNVGCFGKTGSYKSTSFVQQFMFTDIEDPERSTLIVTTVSEDVPRIIAHARKCRGANTRIRYLNWQCPEYSVRWNSFGGLQTKREVEDVSQGTVGCIPMGSSETHYFRMQSRKYLSEIIKALNALTGGKATGSLIRQVVDQGAPAILELARKTTNRVLEIFASNLQNGNRNDETTLCELANCVSVWNDETVEEVTSGSTLNLAELDDSPCILIVEIPEESVDRLRPLTNAFMLRVFHFVLERSKQNGGTLSRPLTITIDEFASAVGFIESMHIRLNTLRKRGVAFTVACQCTAQVFDTYGKSAQALLAGFNHLIFTSPCTYEDAVYASNLAGKITAEEHVVGDGGTVVSRIPVQRPLLTPEEIANPPRCDCEGMEGTRMTFLLGGMRPFQGWIRPTFASPKYRALMKRKFSGNLPLKKHKHGKNSSGQLSLEGLLSSAPGGDGVTDVRGWSEDAVKARLEQVKGQLSWKETTGSARKWWEAFENENRHRLPLVLRLAEELLKRKATITEFFLAYVYSNTDNIQANLFYLDYTRLKKAEEQQKQKAVERIIKVDDDSFQKVVLESSGIAVVLVPAPAHRQTFENLEAVVETTGRGRLFELVSPREKVLGRFHIHVTPSLAIFKKGKLVKHFAVVPSPDDLAAALKRHGGDTAEGASAFAE